MLLSQRVKTRLDGLCRDGAAVSAWTAIIPSCCRRKPISKLSIWCGSGPDRIDASFRNGLLSLRISKLHRVVADSRKIHVRTE
jgi:hypothetical protein